MGEETDVEPGAGQRRMIHTRLRCEDEQRTFDFARKDTIIYTNLGLGGPIDRRLEKAGRLFLAQFRLGRVDNFKLVFLQLTEKPRLLIFDELGEAHDIEHLPAVGGAVNALDEPLGISDANTGARGDGLY